jgi:two-component system, NarL family, sensor histidine kinase UhpB
MVVDTRRQGLIRARAGRRRPTLYRRLFTRYAAVLALAVLLLIFAPVTVSVPVRSTELVVLLAGLVVMLGLFHVLLRRALEPLEPLTR